MTTRNSTAHPTPVDRHTTVTSREVEKRQMHFISSSSPPTPSKQQPLSYPSAMSFATSNPADRASTRCYNPGVGYHTPPAPRLRTVPLPTAPCCGSRETYVHLQLPPIKHSPGIVHKQMAGQPIQDQQPNRHSPANCMDTPERSILGNAPMTLGPEYEERFQFERNDEDPSDDVVDDILRFVPLHETNALGLLFWPMEEYCGSSHAFSTQRHSQNAKRRGNVQEYDQRETD